MLVEEETTEGPQAELNPEAIEALLGDEVIEEEEVAILFGGEGESNDEVDLAFTEDEGYW